MKKYSIKDIEKLTGIKAHTIRVWEQRYELLTPHRTDTNIRYYDEHHLKFLLNVSLLINSGHKISKVSNLSNDELQKQVREVYESSEKDFSSHAIQAKINSLIIAMLEFDEVRFEKVFNTSLIRRGLENTIIEVIEPFVHRMGLMWRTGEVNNAQEHFIYYLVRQKIMVAIDALPLANPNEEKYVLFLPESEFRDLLILFSVYIIKSRGKRVVYLGQDVPFEDLVSVCQITEPETMMTFINAPTSRELAQDYINKLGQAFSKQSVLIASNTRFLEDLDAPENVTLVPSLKYLRDLFENKFFMN